MRIPLGEPGFINLWCEFGRTHKSGILIPWVEALRARLPAKLQKIRRLRETAPTDIDSLVHLAEEVGGGHRTAPAPAVTGLVPREQI